jgi:hypothetical protein
MAAETIGKFTIGTGTFEVVINDVLYEPVECSCFFSHGWTPMNTDEVAATRRRRRKGLGRRDVRASPAGFGRGGACRVDGERLN